MKTTLNKINQALKEKGYNVELVKGKGYFFFQGENTAKWYSSSVPTFHLNALTIEEWITEYETMNEKESFRRAEIYN